MSIEKTVQNFVARAFAIPRRAKKTQALAVQAARARCKSLVLVRCTEDTAGVLLSEVPWPGAKGDAAKRAGEEFSKLVLLDMQALSAPQLDGTPTPPPHGVYGLGALGRSSADVIYVEKFKIEVNPQ